VYIEQAQHPSFDLLLLATNLKNNSAHPELLWQQVASLRNAWAGHPQLKEEGAYDQLYSIMPPQRFPVLRRYPAAPGTPLPDSDEEGADEGQSKESDEVKAAAAVGGIREEPGAVQQQQGQGAGKGSKKGKKKGKK
jgi:hypothetical protein